MENPEICNVLKRTAGGGDVYNFNRTMAHFYYMYQPYTPLPFHKSPFRAFCILSRVSRYLLKMSLIAWRIWNAVLIMSLSPQSARHTSANSAWYSEKSQWVTNG